jgi:hypothetical protein
VRRSGLCAACGASCNRTQSAVEIWLYPAPWHTSLAVQHFLAKTQIPTIIQPPCFPYLTSCEFWLFLRLKKGLKGYRFASAEEIQQNATADLRAVPKENLQRCFKQWQDLWSKCVRAEGQYFEGEWVRSLYVLLTWIPRTYWSSYVCYGDFNWIEVVQDIVQSTNFVVALMKLWDIFGSLVFVHC